VKQYKGKTNTYREAGGWNVCWRLEAGGLKKQEAPTFQCCLKHGRQEGAEGFLIRERNGRREEGTEDGEQLVAPMFEHTSDGFWPGYGRIPYQHRWPLACSGKKKQCGAC
jgi:hypothetical protein